MKTLILILLPIVSFGQFYSTGDWYTLNERVVWESHFEVFDRGNKRCDHDWAVKRLEDNFLGCVFNHGPCGCPDNWENQSRICRKCYRHEHIWETCTVEKGEKESYNEVLKQKNER